MENASKYCLVLVTINSYENAKNTARIVVSENLAACCNILPNITSVYKWDGKIETDGEFLMMIKASQKTLEGLEKRISELHPYDVPEIISLNLEQSSAPYLDWLKEVID